MSPSRRPDYDALYHRLFSHPGVVAQLLRGFVDGPWLADLDLDRIGRLSAKFHAETGERRHGDMIWRIPRRDGGSSYLVLLLEFQSTAERYMAVRLMTYAGLLWQQLIDEKQLGPRGKLPPLLPVIVFNGTPRWKSPVAVRDLVELPRRSALWRLQPGLRYHVIDVGAFSEAQLKARDSLPALWFRLENAPDPASVAAVADAVMAWLSGHPDYAAVKAVFADFLGAMAPPGGAGGAIAEEWFEMQSRLWERAQVWTDSWLQEGIEKGLQKGRQEGLQAGRQEGEAAMLIRLLERRFGALPAWVAARVHAADVATLEEWGLRVLDAGSLDDVVGDYPA